MQPGADALEPERHGAHCCIAVGGLDLERRPVVESKSVRGQVDAQRGGPANGLAGRVECGDGCDRRDGDLGVEEQGRRRHGQDPPVAVAIGRFERAAGGRDRCGHRARCIQEDRARQWSGRFGAGRAGGAAGLVGTADGRDGRGIGDRNRTVRLLRHAAWTWSRSCHRSRSGSASRPRGAARTQ